jgi:hypothetical protein
MLISPWPDQEGNKVWQKILILIYPTYNHNLKNISTIYIYITRIASNEIFSPSNKIHQEVGRAKDLSAPRVQVPLENRELISSGSSSLLCFMQMREGGCIKTQLSKDHKLLVWPWWFVSAVLGHLQVISYLQLTSNPNMKTQRENYTAVMPTYTLTNSAYREN